jgi:hypothetical protein
MDAISEATGAGDVEASDGKKPRHDAGMDSGPKTKDADGPPLLIRLEVSSERDSDAAPSSELVPHFSPDVHDYYVKCARGANAFTVSMTASTGSESLVVQPMVSASSPKQTLSVTAYENQAIVAVATNERGTAEYWVRCLPHDFPQLSMVRHADAGAPPSGYYLLGNLKKETGYAMVLDGDGVPVFYFRAPAGQAPLNVDDIVAGDLSFLLAPAQAIELRALEPPSTTELGEDVDEHELRVLPGGDFIVIYSPLVENVDLTGLTHTLSDGGVQAFGAHTTIRSCDLRQLGPRGRVLWEWVGLNHLDPVKDAVWPEPFTGVTDADGGPIVDVFHCNSIDVDPSSGNLLVSSRFMDSIFYVEKASGKILWKMGGASFTKDDTTYVPVADPFHGQHDARLLPGWAPSCAGGAGQVSMFDDETNGPLFARAMVYDVVVGDLDAGTAGCDGGLPESGAPGARVAWKHEASFSSTVAGSFRISADGSRVIGWGTAGPGDPAFTEVDEDGHDLLDFRFPDGDQTYRAIKVPLTAFDLSVLRNTAGLP